MIVHDRIRLIGVPSAKTRLWRVFAFVVCLQVGDRRLGSAFKRYTNSYYSLARLLLLMPPQTAEKTMGGFSFERASVWALIATVIVSAVILIPSASVPFLPTKTFLLAIGTIIAFGCFIVARLTKGNVILPPVALVGALWLPVLAYLLSGVFSGVGISNAFFGTSLEPDTLGFVLVAAFLGTLAALALRRADQYKTFFVSLAYALGLVLVVELLIVIIGHFAQNTISPALSILGSYDDLGFVLGLGVIGILLTLRYLNIMGRARAALLVAGAVSLFFLAVANSSLIWILVALVAFALFIEAVMQRNPGAADAELEGTSMSMEMQDEHDHGHRPLAVPLVVLLVSLFFLFGSTLGSALANSLHVNVLSVRPSWQSTLAVGGKVYSSSPVFGSGPTTFGTEWVKYRDASLNQTVFWNVDFSSGIGYIPTSFVTTGIVGVLAWILLVGLFAFYGIRTVLLRAPKDHYVRYVSVLSFVSSIYLLVISVFALPNAEVLALMFVSLGVFASTLRFAEGGTQWGIAFSRSPRLGFVIVFALTLLLLASIVGAYGLIERYIAQLDLTRAAVALSNGDLDGADALTASSIGFAPSPTAYQAQAQIAQARLQVIAASTTLSSTNAQQLFQTALSAGINAALTATRVAPNDYQNWMMLGNLYATVVPLGVSGAFDNAKTAYTKAAELNPTAPAIPYALAQLSVANKDNKGAEDYLKQAITLKQDYTAAIFLLSQVEVQSGNLKDALTAAEAAAYFTPTDPNVLFQLGLLRAANNDTNGAITALAAAVNVNPQFANARYFLAAAYAKKGDTADALTEMQAIAALSQDNAKAVQSAISTLQSGKNPFPANLLSSTSTPISQ